MRGYYSEPWYYSILEYIPVILGVIIGIIVLSAVFRTLKKSSRKGYFSGMGVDQGFFGMRGRTSEQKKIIKYFNSTGILGAIFRISNSTFDEILSNAANNIASNIATRALSTHAIDEYQVREIQPILVENYYAESRYYKLFRDLTFRASEYQMTYLTFSDKQMYVYSYIFDLTSENTTEQTRDYFYNDITAVDVTHSKIEFPQPRPLAYLLGGIAGIIIGLLSFIGMNIGAIIFGLILIAVGIIVAYFIGYKRATVDSLILKITVPNNEFICSMNHQNIAAIQGMKAKIREKKQ